MTKKEIEICQRVSDISGLSLSEVTVLRNTVAKDTDEHELLYFIEVFRSLGLNPYTREVWCYKKPDGELVVFAGRDGHLAYAQRQPKFNGMRSCEVRENDEWEIDVPNAQVYHKITKKSSERGEIVGAYAFVFREGGEPTLEFSEFDSYNLGVDAWSTHPVDMIKKVPETKALKKAFGMSGIQSEYDWTIKGGVAVPINTTEAAKSVSTPDEHEKMIESFDDLDKLLDYATYHKLDEDEDLQKKVQLKLKSLKKVL